MTAPQLEARHITVTFASRGQAFDAVQDASVFVNPGEAVGIVGESGSGKTTLARVLVGLQLPSKGEVYLEGNRVLAARECDVLDRADRWKIQMIFQDPYTSLNPRMRAWEGVAEAVQVWQRLGRKDAREQALSLLKSVGISPEQAEAFPRALSGGQRQRISVARALAPAPMILIADEPTSSIDQSAQAQLLNVFRKLQRERGLTILFISHDLGLIRYLTSRVYVMKKGLIVEAGPTAQVFDRPEHAYTQQLIGSIPGRRVIQPAPGLQEGVS